MTAPIHASMTPQAARRNRRVAFTVLGVALFMCGAAFAAVPLYKLFCQVTGFGGTPRIVSSESLTRGERTLTVRFDANTSGELDWHFQPETTSIRLQTGVTATVFYRVTNRSNRPVTGMATYNVAPDQAGAFFNKIACFCFTEQTLAPGETIEMPVVFFLDPALEKDQMMKYAESVTLSYTFVPVKQPQAAPVAARYTGPSL
jgi:cytochrome c oxidase assembly protein subunit 11